MSKDFDKLSVLDSFIEEVNSYLPEIEANLDRLAQSPGDMDALEETYRRSHTIGGSASMMDFPGLAHVAHGMEDILGDALDGLTTLDEPTLALLRRSLGRLHHLLEGVRSGVNEEAIIAEDDADYSQYRARLEASFQQHGAGSVGDVAQTAGMMSAGMAVVPAGDQLYDLSPSSASFEDVLASFRSPSVSPGEEVEWPEELVPTGQFEAVHPTPTFPTVPPTPVLPVSPTPFPAVPLSQSQLQVPADVPNFPFDPMPSQSALETLVASTRKTPAVVPSSPSSSIPPVAPIEPIEAPREVLSQEFYTTEAPGDYSTFLQYQQPPYQENEPPVWSESRELVAQDSLPLAYDNAQKQARALEEQASSLRGLIEQMRSAMVVIENQRAEFKSFLDGSKDALDRMEDWAGRAMGLNLRNSPEQVRRYLPLSVMWVSNSKLKKVLDSLNHMANGAEVTDGQMEAALHQLQASLEACGNAFRELQLQGLQQQPGWTPWEMQVAHDVNQMRERVTFERQGDPAALRREIEAQLREEMQREYESRPISLALRAELEQQIRNEMREEFAARRRLEESVVGTEVTPSIQALEARLRNEIEIQVRQEFLDQLAVGGTIGPIDSAPTLQPPPDRAPAVSNFAERAQALTSFSASPAPPRAQPQALPPMPPPVAAPPLVVPATPPSTPPPASLTSAAARQASSFNAAFSEEAIEIFRLEAEEHLQTISMHVAALEKAPTNRDLIQGIRRATHTLKGAAGMMGFRAIADLSHISEDLLDSIMEGTTTISPPVLSIILDTAETLDMLIAGRGADEHSDEARVQALRIRYSELLGEGTSALPASYEDIDLDVENVEEAVDMGIVVGMVESVPSGEANVQRTARGDLNVRVRLQKLDELVNLFGEILVNRSVLEERIQRLVRLVADVGLSSARLRDVGQKLESRFEAATLPSGRSVQVMPGEGNQKPQSLLGGSSNGSGQNGNKKDNLDFSHLEEFDELELDRYTEFHQLARGLSEGISDMSTLSTEMEAIIREAENVFGRESRLHTTFQDRLMKVRLVPLSTMAPRLYRAARAVALKQRKEFEFLLEGEETEVDRTVFEEIAGPLLHLMRNAANHALETPEIRIQKGKSPAGQIKLSASYEGNQVVITVRDDGTGIDPEHVRNAAITRGLISPDQELDEGDLIDLIFRPGFSTAEFLSEESGRGVGLDVVRDSVARLRGTLEVESMAGQGTAFTMKFPTSLAIQSAMMVMVSGQQFAIPTVMVETIGRLDNFKRATLGGQPAVLVHNDLYPLHTLSQYLSLPVTQIDDKAPLLLVNAGGHRVALVVDDIKGKYEIVMKNLGPHLRHVHGVAGATVLGNGRVVLILELIDLLSSRVRNLPGFNAPAGARREGGTAMVPAVQAGAQGAVRQVDLSPARQAQGSTAAGQNGRSGTTVERGRHVLVVDDSPSVRRVVSSMLKQNGWEVQMARDGVEALEMITYEPPAAVLLDIEMPRMDGYELIATVRAQEQYRTLPLVVLTSRAASKHQQRALQLGANGYVVKPYQDEELLNTLNSLVYGASIR